LLKYLRALNFTHGFGLDFEMGYKRYRPVKNDCLLLNKLTHPERSGLHDCSWPKEKKIKKKFMDTILRRMLMSVRWVSLFERHDSFIFLLSHD
jgi:hypothetical protein